MFRLIRPFPKLLPLPSLIFSEFLNDFGTYRRPTGAINIVTSSCRWSEYIFGTFGILKLHEICKYSEKSEDICQEEATNNVHFHVNNGEW